MDHESWASTSPPYPWSTSQKADLKPVICDCIAHCAKRLECAASQTIGHCASRVLRIAVCNVGLRFQPTPDPRLRAFQHSLRKRDFPVRCSGTGHAVYHQDIQPPLRNVSSKNRNNALSRSGPFLLPSDLVGGCTAYCALERGFGFVARPAMEITSRWSM